MNIGDPAPDFELHDQDGAARTLGGMLSAGESVVLFFYPAAMTPGCTAESCHFRDLAAEFAEAGARRVGISADNVDTQRAFADKNGFDYPLLSDPDGTVAVRYGVRRSGPLAALSPTRRTTFVIGSDQRIRHVIKSELRMQAHADGALRVLREGRKQSGRGG
ncbi:peroxiredoxin [Streptomonospora litoralis]|uniref:thioredoxin-dependent peroxiredoxin n=1 Tax=Streptomonospora litoralis TaxID=2498135 RepID=A0A4P6Q8H0_9ACTN|nr:peroxiredoxin [Streptomonospora litoralis]QBI55247.1 Putative peroxiredoxin bcp [Streptomonospora litoralis]